MKTIQSILHQLTDDVLLTAKDLVDHNEGIENNNLLPLRWVEAQEKALSQIQELVEREVIDVGVPIVLTKDDVAKNGEKAGDGVAYYLDNLRAKQRTNLKAIMGNDNKIKEVSGEKEHN